MVQTYAVADANRIFAPWANVGRFPGALGGLPDAPNRRLRAANPRSATARQVVNRRTLRSCSTSRKQTGTNLRWVIATPKSRSSAPVKSTALRVAFVHEAEVSVTSKKRRRELRHHLRIAAS